MVLGYSPPWWGRKGTAGEAAGYSSCVAGNKRDGHRFSA